MLHMEEVKGFWLHSGLHNYWETLRSKATEDLSFSSVLPFKYTEIIINIFKNVFFNYKRKKGRDREEEMERG